MVPVKSYAIYYDSPVRAHLAAIEPKFHGLIRKTVEQQLTHQPEQRTRNRKPLEGATDFGHDRWELRFGPHNRFRVLYSVDREAGEVWVVGIGVKEGNRLVVGGEEITL
jgi:hypothetical protein